jgi:tRNA pseudouridine55 synthase
MRRMDGFLVVDKATGLSSYDVIRRLKRLCRFKKIGYVGTLDKNATGILPIAINEGVKLIPFLEDEVKVYSARFLVGVKTDTYDIRGNVVEKMDVEPLERERIEAHLRSFEGRIRQKIPPFSAKKIEGRPLYRWAREGKMIELLKEVEIYEIKLIDYSHPFVDVEVSCSKGTYVRSLAHEFGLSLGVGATLYALRRLRHGHFAEDKAIPLERINSEEDIASAILPLEEVLPSLKKVRVEKNIERFIRHGMPYPLYGSKADWRDRELVKFLDREGLLIGIGEVDLKSNTMKVRRLINRDHLEGQ